MLYNPAPALLHLLSPPYCLCQISGSADFEALKEEKKTLRRIDEMREEWEMRMMRFVRTFMFLELVEKIDTLLMFVSEQSAQSTLLRKGFSIEL